MKKNFILLVVVLALTAVTAAAQENKLNSAPASFRAFFSNFKRAVVKGDKHAVADLTRFPFKAVFDAGDEADMTKAQFIKRFRDVFSVDAGEYLTDEYLTFSRGNNGSYNVSNGSDASHMIFVKLKNTYRFTAMYSEP